jgi:hypothetical protein
MDDRATGCPVGLTVLAEVEHAASAAHVTSDRVDIDALLRSARRIDVGRHAW